jgi:tRNA pseudouridine32 synthase/23S rRNA pseudouridine746 synthase
MTTTAAAGFATADTTTTTTTEVRPPSVVSLVWKEEAVEENSASSSSTAVSASTTSATWNVSLQDMPEVAASAVPVPDNHNHNNNNNNHKEGVDLAWQLARQQRKVQHARRVGQIVETKALAIVYEDAHVVVVDKPGGVLTVPGLRQHASLLDAVHAHIVAAASATGNGDTSNDDDNSTLDDARHTQPAHRIVHRLDMDTSGLVVFGKTLAVTKVLQAHFRQHDESATKVYQAAVVGHVPVDAGTIDLPLQRDIEHAPFMRVATSSYEKRARQTLALLHADGHKKQWTYQKPKPSVTRFTVVRRGYYPVEATTVLAKNATPNASCSGRSLPFTILELQPVTGRTHQLRVHCAALGFPIIGDPTYGWHGEAAPAGGLRGILRTHSGVADALLVAWNAVHVPNADPLCLHAARLSLPHPHDAQQIMAWSTPAPFLARFD